MRPVGITLHRRRYRSSSGHARGRLTVSGSRLLAGLLTFTLVATACASSSNRETALQNAAQRELVERSGGSRFDLDELPTDDEQRCLRDSDATGDGLDVRATLDAYLTCLTDVAEYDPFVAGVVVSLELSFNNRFELSAAASRCFVRQIVETSPDPARTLASPARIDPDVYGAAAQRCFPAEAYDVLVGAAGPSRYGDDADLDGLHDRCAEGDGVACDLLRLNVAIESEYALVARTCGDRRLPSVDFCSEDVTLRPGARIIADGTSGTDRLRAACIAGDVNVCDLLYGLSAPGSALERFGATCGEMLSVPAIPNCRTALGG